MAARPAFFDRQPAQQLLDTEGLKGEHCQATIAADRMYLMVYFPQRTLTRRINVSRLTGTRTAAWWFNPGNGHCYTQEGQPSQKPVLVFSKADQSFTPPAGESLSDWVLILDDYGQHYPMP